MSRQTLVQRISAAETWPLRQRVLRPLAGLEDCIFPHDDDATTLHLGLFHCGRLTAVASFMLQSHPDFSAGAPYRLRGMAVDEKYRGRGFGGVLLRAGLNELRDLRCDLLWFNARVRAFPFYQRMGFELHGELFDTGSGAGLHKTMYKHLNPR